MNGRQFFLHCLEVQSLHGFSHTILGSVVYGIFFSLLQQLFHKVYLQNKLKPTLLTIIWFLSIILFHIIPDMLIYPDLLPFFPISSINFGHLQNYLLIARILSYFWLVGLGLNILAYWQIRRQEL